MATTAIAGDETVLEAKKAKLHGGTTEIPKDVKFLIWAMIHEFYRA